jgi:hypothetical protein
MAITSPTTVSVPDDGTSPIGSNEWNATVGLIMPKVDTATNLYVRTDGSDSNTGLVDSAAGAFLTIQKAVNTVMGWNLDGDGAADITINVGAGTFSEAVLLGTLTGRGYEQIVTIQGAGLTTIVEGPSSGSSSFVADGGGSRWTIRNLTCKPNDAGFVYGIAAFNGAYVRLSGEIGFTRGLTQGDQANCLGSAHGGQIIARGFATNFTIAGYWTKFMEVEYWTHMDIQPNNMTLTSSPQISTWVYCDETSQATFINLGTITGGVTANTRRLYAASGGHVNIIENGTALPEAGGQPNILEACGFSRNAIGGLQYVKNDYDYTQEMRITNGSSVGGVYIGASTGTTLPGQGNLSFGDGKGVFDDAGNEQLIFQQTTSAVNYIEVTNATSGNPPIISAQGETNVGLLFQPKGPTGTVVFEVPGAPASPVQAFLGGQENPQVLFTGGTRAAGVDVFYGPAVAIRANETTPYTNGYAGGVRFQGNDSNGVSKTYGSIWCKAPVRTAGSHAGVVEVYAATTGSAADADAAGIEARFGNGLTLGVIGSSDRPGGGNLKATGFLQPGKVLTTNLPAASTANEGARHYVTDATTNAFMVPVVGGSTYRVPVVSNGTGWVIG